MADPCTRITRPLYDWEIQEAYRVFGDKIHYAPVRIHECAGWPDSIYKLSLKFQGRTPDAKVHNAITVGNHCYFPTPMCVALVPPDHPEFFKIPWLIHELTHVWQYQRMGWRYLFAALKAQTSLGAAAYQFGGEEGLRTRGSSGARLQDFNLEQQGDIARSYYERLAKGEDTSAWTRYVAELQGIDSTNQRA
jgi:hypothetical protein